MAAKIIHTVIEMDSLQIGKPNDAVKLVQNTVQVIHNIITAVPYMTGIQTNSQLVSFFYLIHDNRISSKVAPISGALSPPWFPKARSCFAPL